MCFVDELDFKTPIDGNGVRLRRSTLARPRLLSPAEVSKLTEHTMRVTGVICPSPLSIRGLVIESSLHDWRLELCRSHEWVRRLLHGMNMKNMKPAMSEKDPRSPGLQDANARRLFMKLRWLMEQHDVKADRVINIDEGAVYCRCKRSAGAVEARLVRWRCWCKSCTRRKQPQCCRRSRSRRTHCTLSLRTASAISSTTVELAIASDGVKNPAGHSRAWIPLWGLASVHASEVTLAFMKVSLLHVALCFIPSQSTSYLQLSGLMQLKMFYCIEFQFLTTIWLVWCCIWFASFFFTNL